MISFRTKKEMGASIAILVSLAALLGTGIYMIVVPAPSTSSVVADGARSRNKIQDEITEANQREKQAKDAIAPHLWTLPPDQIGPRALANVTKLAIADRLKLLAFRPQKPADVNGLTQFPFQISVDGPFPAVMSLMRQLEQPETKLATSLVQIASAEASSDRVTATIGVMAYREKMVETNAKQKPTR